ncbi:MAG: diaminopimelate epimerase [Gammaproteobacteria bacterium]
MLLPFSKMHGLGNDFMVLDLISTPVNLSADLIRALGDRHFGIGFDQLLLIEPPTEPDIDFNYRIYNCDGNEVEHCGNGARCFARFVLDKGLSQQHTLRVKTKRGVIILHVEDNGFIRVDMGAPDFNPAALAFNAAPAQHYQRSIELQGKTKDIQFYCASMGNPHAVIVVDNLETTPVQEIGEALGAHPDFTEGVNVGFMQILDRNTIKLRVFERGAGETLACGTGACAAVACGHHAGLLDSDVCAHLTGGDLNLTWNGAETSVIMRGPAVNVFEGHIDLNKFS